MSLKKLLLESKLKITLYVLGVLLSASTGILSTYGVANAFSVLEAKNTEEVIRVFITSGLLLASPALIQLMSRMLRIGFMSETLAKVRSLAYRKMMRQSIEKHSDSAKEAYRSRMTSDVNLFEKDFFLSLLNLGFAFFSSLISFVILLSYSWIVACITLLVSVLQFVIARHYEEPVRTARKITQTENKAFNTISSNIISGFRNIKSFSSQKRFLRRFNGEVERLEEAKSEFFKLNKRQEVLSQGLASMAVVANFFIATYLLQSNHIKVVDVIVVINLSSQLIWVMINGISFVNRLKASVDIFHNLCDDDAKTRDEQGGLEGFALLVENLTVQYEDNVVIDDLSFALRAKEKLLIHGPSGTGKTSLLNCLSQNLSHYEGKISYGEIDLKSVNHRSFLDKASYIRQTHFMFDDSIKNNIIMNRPFNEKRFYKALKDAALLEWITGLEERENYELLENGSNISGGQRQRISIARELYADHDLIFIDEPSASLDDATAEAIYDTILNLDKTVICVSHRHLDYLKDKFNQTISFEEVNA